MFCFVFVAWIRLIDIKFEGLNYGRMGGKWLGEIMIELTINIISL